MKTLPIALLGLALLVLSVLLMNSGAAQSAKTKGKSLRHVVLFKFQQEATQEQIADVVKGFRELPSKIDAIQEFEFGTNVSPEGHDKGFTHCFLVTFRTEADRDAYLPHPAHQAFVAQLKPILDDVTVVDYWAQE